MVSEPHYSAIWGQNLELMSHLNSVRGTVLSHLPVWIGWPLASMVLEPHYSAICGKNLELQ